MKANRTITGAALAAAAASLIMTTAVGTVHAQEAKKIQCEGVNACKGQNDCSTAKNGCKGMGACKGQGFMSMTQADCDKAKAKMAAAEKKEKPEGKAKK